jgi:hypothetical protein
MAHFAQLDENNIVIQVIVVGDEYESNFATSRLEFGEMYVQTSYNGNIRKNYAGIGYLWDSIRDAFIAPQPDCHPDLISLNEETCQWICTGNHERFIEITE